MEDANMTTPSKNNAAFKAVKAELISMVPLAFRSMAKPYITEEHVTRILKAALSAIPAAEESLRNIGLDDWVDVFELAFDRLQS